MLGREIHRIAVHANTKDDLLTMHRADSLTPLNGHLTNPHKEHRAKFTVKDMTTAEVSDRRASPRGINTTPMDDDMFMEWVEKHLTTSFEALHPGENNILVWSNPSHHVQHPGV